MSESEPLAATTEIQELARDQLGSLRDVVSGELRRLPDCLERGEHAVCMGMGGRRLRGRLIVATDRRLLLLSKWPLRPLRCEEFPYERLTSMKVKETGTGNALVLTLGGEAQSWQVTRPFAREVAKLAAERIGPEKVFIDGEAEKAKRERGTTRRLVGQAAGWAVTAALGLGFVIVVGDLREPDDPSPSTSEDHSDEELVAGQCLGLGGESLSCASQEAVFKVVETGSFCFPRDIPAQVLSTERVREAESRGLCVEPVPFHSKR